MNRRWIPSAVAVALAGTVVTAQMQMVQNPARDAIVAPTGPAEISGVILTDEETPRPVRRAEVRLFAPGTPGQTAYSDPDGRFTFRNLAYGRYTIEANKPGFVRVAYGARRYDRSGTPVTVSDAARTHDLQMRMPRGAVITGRIVDDFGQPAYGARVTIQQVRIVNGERTVTPVPMVSSILGEMVDDRGVFRLFGLPAGDYVVSATPRSVGVGDIRRMTDAEIVAARQALAQQPGATAPADAPQSPVTLGFSQVYYPGVLSLNDAAIITVGSGEERANIDFAATLVRTATISGAIIAPAGVAPQSARLFLSPKGSSNIVSSGGQGTTMVFTAVSLATANRQINPDGTFVYPGVAPGQYTLSASATRDGGTPLWAAADITIDGQPLDGVTLALSEGLTVSGSVQFEADGVDEPDTFTRARIMMLPTNSTTFMAGVTAGLAMGRGPQVTPDKRFSIPGLVPGPHRVQATFNTPEANWILKSAIIKGQDALDVPFMLEAGDAITDAVLTFTNRTQELSGQLSDASGRPAPDFTVVVFPEEQALWRSDRRIRTARPGTDGRYTIANLPAGTYRIAAVTDIAPGEERDATLLQELLAASIQVVIADGEQKTQDIRIR
jgi:hypothetical protein